jgi:lipoate-protein ligase A
VVVLANPDSDFLSIGVHQDVSREIDVYAAASQETPIYRRETGGPALFLSANDLMVHFVVPRGRPEARGNATGLYQRFAEPLVRTWQGCGLPVEHGAWGGIRLERYRVGVVHAGIVGNAVVVGGSLVPDFDADTIAQQASLPSYEMRERMRDQVRELLSRAAGRPSGRAAVKDALLSHMADALSWTARDSELRDDELAAIDWRETQMLDREHRFMGGRRMANAELHARGGLRLVDVVHRGSGGLVRLRFLERDGAIADIEITGELTCLPADGLEKLATRLVGLRRDAPDLGARIQLQVGLLGLELPGVTAGNLAATLRPPPVLPPPDPFEMAFRGGPLR